MKCWTNAKAFLLKTEMKRVISSASDLSSKTRSIHSHHEGPQLQQVNRQAATKRPASGHAERSRRLWTRGRPEGADQADWQTTAFRGGRESAKV